MSLIAKLGTVLVGSILFSGCATIIGGSKYNAHVEVTNRPNAKIYYLGELKGSGNASFKVRRMDANKFSLLIKEDGWQEQNFIYTSRAFRGGAFVGTILTWTGLISGIPIPWGVFVDLATGALYKPNIYEKGVVKENFKNFRYFIDTSPVIASNTDDYFIDDVVYLKDGSIIRGKIIEQVPDLHIKIQKKNGSIAVYKAEEIDRLAREEYGF